MIPMTSKDARPHVIFLAPWALSPLIHPMVDGTPAPSTERGLGHAFSPPYGAPD